MNQLEQMKKERDPKEMLLMTGCPNCGQDNNIEYVKNVIDEIRVNAYLAGQQAERESTNNIITKERDTWARESIGDKALQSLEIALINSKE